MEHRFCHKSRTIYALNIQLFKNLTAFEEFIKIIKVKNKEKFHHKILKVGELFYNREIINNIR